MPLVIALLVIAVLLVNAVESNKKYANESALREKNSQKTNAKLEQRVLDMYMKHGYSFDEAFRMTYEDMIKAGFDPCIPKEGYKMHNGEHRSSTCGNGYGYELERYDSFMVRQRNKSLREEYQKENPGKTLTDEEYEDLLYSHFPSSEGEYNHELKRQLGKSRAEAIGSFIIYPHLGTCEVMAHNWIGDGALGGTYTLRVLRTGKIVEYVRIGDPRIRRQG